MTVGDLRRAQSVSSTTRPESMMTATDSTEPTIQAHRDADTPLSHVAVVSAIYDAFGRGDVSTILGFLDDDVHWDADWSDNWAQRTPLDHLTPPPWPHRREPVLPGPVGIHRA